MNTQVEFWAHVQKTETCWMWTGYRSPQGYGMLYFQGETIFAHRLAYRLKKGSLRADMLVCHHCDTPPCVRPSHLFQGTHQENMQDMVRKGRHVKRGPDEHFALDFHLIRSLLVSREIGETDFAFQVGVCSSALSRGFCKDKGFVTLRLAQKISLALGINLALLKKKLLSEEELAVRLACTVLGPPLHNLLLFHPSTSSLGAAAPSLAAGGE